MPSPFWISEAEGSVCLLKLKQLITDKLLSILLVNVTYALEALIINTDISWILNVFESELGQFQSWEVSCKVKCWAIRTL